MIQYRKVSGKKFKILVQTLLKFILLANSPKKIVRPAHVMDSYRQPVRVLKDLRVSGSSGCSKCNIYSVPVPGYRQASSRRVTYIMSKSCDSCKVTCRVGSKRIYQKDHLMIISWSQWTHCRVNFSVRDQYFTSPNLEFNGQDFLFDSHDFVLGLSLTILS